MNDTETEARRLLAAATKDMPPGIDLLGGFVAARRRDRARQTRVRAALSAGVAVAAASVTAVALTIGSAPSAIAIVTSALTRTMTQSYHATWQESVNTQNAGVSRWPACTSEADPVHHLEATFCSNRPVELVVGSYTYDWSAEAYHGKHWARYPNASLRPLPAVGDFVFATPQRMLSQIEQELKVTVIGPASGPGWTGTRYAFASSDRYGTISGTLDVDWQGRARALHATIRTGGAGPGSVMMWVVKFSDFGARVTVTPPPPDQTFVPPIGR